LRRFPWEQHDLSGVTLIAAVLLDTSHGESKATFHGDRVEGTFKTAMTMQGRAMEMNMGWQGKRLGDCPSAPGQ